MLESIKENTYFSIDKTCKLNPELYSNISPGDRIKFIGKKSPIGLTYDNIIKLEE